MGGGDLTFLPAMWYNDYDYNQPVSPHPMRGGRAIRRSKMLKLWSVEEIRNMIGAEAPIEGCMVVEVNLQLMQVAFTTEQPPAEWKYFEYEYDPRDTACIPLFVQPPVYGVFLGPVRGGIPLAILSQAKGANFGLASFRGGEHRFIFILRVHEAARAAFRDRCVRLGDRVIVAFPYDPKKVEWAKAHGGKFFPDLKAWVFPAECEEKVKEALLK
jgi:hypothetical protein